MEIRLVKLGRIILAVLFLFSAISKILSLAFFDGLIAELFIGKDYFNHPNALWYTQVFTRVIIAGEMALGLAVVQERWLKKLVLPTIQLILLAFTVHLFYVGFTKGFIGENCGCFGDLVPMDNLESIIKNVIAMAIGAYVWKFHRDSASMYFPSWVTPVVGGVVTLVTLWLTIKTYEPVSLPEVPPVKEIMEEEPISTETLDELVDQYKFEEALNRLSSKDSLSPADKQSKERLKEIINIQKK